MKGKGVCGRVLLLTCLIVASALSQAIAQTPPKPVVPIVSASPNSQSSPTPAAAATPLASPAPAAVSTPAAMSPTPSHGGTLHLPSEAPEAKPGEWKREGEIGQSTFVDKLRTVTWALAFICFLVWLVAKLAGKGTLEKFGLPAEPGSLIEVLEKKRLSPGRSIMVVKVGPKVLAVAVTESGFRTLTEIDGEALKQHQDALREEVSAAAQTEPGTTGPSHIAKHYLSIIPGLGAKK